MLTLALYGLLAVVLIGCLFLVAARLLPAGEQIAPPVRDEAIWELPAERALAAADVAEVRLPVALRGYRFAETDLLLDRLVEELRARDSEIAQLRATPAGQRGGALPEAPGGQTQTHRPPPEVGWPDGTAPGQLDEPGPPPEVSAEPAVDAGRPGADGGPPDADAALSGGAPLSGGTAADAGSPGPAHPAPDVAIVRPDEHGDNAG